MGCLYEADQTGKFKSRRIMQGRYLCDTIKKEFSELSTSKNNEYIKADLSPMLQVDDEIVNPKVKSAFVIQRNQVPIPPDYDFPFAVLSAG